MLSAAIRIARLFKSPKLAARWATEFIDDRVTTPHHKKHLNYYAHRQLPIAEGITQATGFDPSEVKKYLNTLPSFLVSNNKDPGMGIRWSATSELSSIIYALIRIMKPDIVVETGVGAGVSSWTILHALQENHSGKLVSIDLPTPNTQLIPEVGYLVPAELRVRWNLIIGSSRQILPQVLSTLGKIDLFQHDSRHSYSNQLREYQSAWPFIKKGGILISDDIGNDALYEATQSWHKEPSIIAQDKAAPIGLVRKF